LRIKIMGGRWAAFSLSVKAADLTAEDAKFRKGRLNSGETTVL